MIKDNLALWILNVTDALQLKNRQRQILISIAGGWVQCTVINDDWNIACAFIHPPVTIMRSKFCILMPLWFA